MASALSISNEYISVQYTSGRLGKTTPGLILVLPLIFARHIVLGDFFRVNFSHVRVRCVFHACDRFGLEVLPFLDQFFYAFTACFRHIRQSLRVPGLARRTGTEPLLSGRHGTVRSHAFIVFVLHTVLGALHLPMLPLAGKRAWTSKGPSHAPAKEPP